MTRQSVKVPRERIGVLIGKDGGVKAKVENQTGVKMLVDSEEGDVTVDYSKAEDPSAVLSVMDFITAIGRGFSPEKAMLVLDDDWYLEVIDIRDYVGKKPAHVARMRARVIGTKGKTRRLFEELTGVYMSVYGNTVALIGDTLKLDIARRALDMLLSGSEHSAVYRFLESKRVEIKIDGMGF
ncbi:MAG: KH domain-containing protein [Thermoplasmata archaeon]|nr:KH domain-containing protein [Thermoplasmata archaeon]